RLIRPPTGSSFFPYTTLFRSNYSGDYGQYPIDASRFRRVLTLAAEKAGWGKQKPGNGYGIGVAMHRSFLTYVATVVQVQVDDAGDRESTRLNSSQGSISYPVC